MRESLLLIASLIYGIILLILFVYGINFLYLAYLTIRRGGPDPEAPPMTNPPKVSVQLPIYNELYVAERLIDTAAGLEWARDRLEILVLDDSTDETRGIVERAVTRWQSEGVNMTLVHRENRKGFKAGALSAGMKATDAEFVAYFDADFIPSPDFLLRTIPHFATPNVAFVQTRWGHINRDYSFLTMLQSLAVDAHFVVEQYARSRGGYWFNFNGTAGVWRRRAIEEAGGWRADTLTEDLDVSYRAFLKGWKAVYLRDIVTPAELPVTFTAFRRQQHRWAKGSLETAAKLLPTLWTARTSLRQKFQGTLHLTGYSIHIFMFVLMLVYPAVIYYADRFPALLPLYAIGGIFNISALAPTFYFTLAQKHVARNWWQRVPAVVFMMALGAGMMMNTVRAAWQIVMGQGRTFERTPKFGIKDKKQAWVTSRYQVQIDPLVVAELLVGLWNLGTMVYALSMHNWIIALYSAIYLVGVLFVTGLTIAQTIELWSFKKKSESASVSAPVN